MKSTFKIISVLFILTLICFYGFSVLADDSTTTTDQTTPNTTADQTTPDTTAIDEPAADITPTVTDRDNQLATSIASKFNATVTGQDIRNLRVSGMGYGSITIAYAIASASGKSVSDLTTMRQQGLGWGQIAGQLGVKFSDLLGKSSQTLKSAKLNDEAKAVKAQAKQEASKSNNNNSKNNNGSDKSSNNSSSHNSSSSSSHSGGNSGGKH